MILRPGREVTMTTRYYHGGNKGLSVGDYILPAATTGAESTSDLVATFGNHRRDRVYVSTVLKDAQLFAARSGSRLCTKSSRKERLSMIQTSKRRADRTLAKKPRSSRFTRCLAQ
jgi:hypothetical protein